jgi:membrane protein implicated in regulation of membrane protease activity
MNALKYLFTWANAPYTMAAGVAILFALMQASGLLGLLAGGGDADGDADHDVDADVDHDVDADVDHDVDADADADNDHDADDAGHGHGIGATIFAPLGFGKIPFSIIWQTYALVFALAGLAINAAFAAPNGQIPLLTLAWSVPISIIAGYAAVSALARVLGPVLSSKAQEATSRAELVGQIGVVISSKVSSEFGEVRVKDKSGHELRVICKLAAGMREPAEKEQVVIVEFDKETGLFVAPLDMADAVPKKKKRASTSSQSPSGAAPPSAPADSLRSPPNLAPSAPQPDARTSTADGDADADADADAKDKRAAG